KSLAMQQRRRVHAVLDLELAVALLGVEPPDLFPLEIEAGEVPGAREGVDLFAVGARRRRGLVALIIAETCPAGAEPAFPQQPAIGTDAKEHNVLAVLAGQENAIAAACRRGPADT